MYRWLQIFILLLFACFIQPVFLTVGVAKGTGSLAVPKAAAGTALEASAASTKAASAAATEAASQAPTTPAATAPVPTAPTTGATQSTAQAPFVPDSYWQATAPQQITPGSGVARLDWTRTSGRTGRVEQSRVIYDEFGRQKFRVDKTDHMRPEAHTNPHLHETEYYPKPNNPISTERRHDLR